MDTNTLRILEIDGGGARGYLALKFLISFIDIWGINPNELWKYFNCICGTSVGGMIALGLAIGKSPQELLTFLETKAPLIFSTNGTPSSKAGTLTKLYSITVSGVPFYGTETGTGYGSALLASELQTMFGTKTMQEVLTNVVIPTYKVNMRENTANIDDGVYTLCSNIRDINFAAQDELISNVALSTSAAPFYLPSINLENTNQNVLNGRYIDGGIYQNNPSSFGINIAQIVKPTAKRTCILSIGTGLGEMGFDDESPPDLLRSAEADPIIGISNLFALFGVASTGGQEAVNKSLEIESKYSLNQLYHYRFQPDLDIEQDTELDSTTSSVFQYYDTVNSTWVSNDMDNIAAFLGHLII